MRVKLLLAISLIILLSAACDPTPDPDLSAWIEQPSDGAQLDQLPINLHVVGQANLGIDSFDLYINGQLEDSFSPQQTGSTSGGPTKFFSEYLWSPPGTGIFVLGVRAHGGNGGISPFSQITIEIQPPTVQEANPPIIEKEGSVLLPTIPNPVVPYSGDPGGEAAQFPGYSPETWAIATPIYPAFFIKSAQLHFCENQWYVMIEVKNSGPYFFQWISINIFYDEFHYQNYTWETPWRSIESECPFLFIGNATLAPGEAAFIYAPVSPVDLEIEYFISLWMCTYNSTPYSCPREDYVLDERLPSVQAEPVLEIKELALCWVGPGSDFEVVNSIPVDTKVDLLGIGDVEGFLVVQEPKYQRPCWLRSERAEDVPDEVLRELSVFETPLLAEGVVSGQVFKDQDANGTFGGSDVGFPGARVSLAPGSCSNYGQAITKTTNNVGWFSFNNVAPGPYCLFVQKPNTCQRFSTANSFDVAVDWGSVIEKNFGLESCR